MSNKVTVSETVQTVTVSETTNQVIVTAPNSGAIKVVEVGVRGPKGEENANVGNLNIGIGEFQNQITVRSADARDLFISANVYSPEANIVIGSNVVPANNEVQSLGAPDRRFKELWVADGTIFIGANSSISGQAIDISNFNVAPDGTIRIPGVSLQADANAIDTVTIVASDIASNATIIALTGDPSNLTTPVKDNIVASINSISSNTEERLDTLDGNVVQLTANIGVVSSNLDAYAAYANAAIADVGGEDIAILQINVASLYDNVVALADNVEANINSTTDNAVALDLRVSANLDIITANVESLDIRTQANIDLTTANAEALDSRVTANLNTLADNATALETSVTANLNLISSNVVALDEAVTANLNTLTANVENLDTAVTANLNTLTANVENLDTAVTANLNVLTVNTEALDTAVTANLNILTANTEALDVRVTANLDVITANVEALDTRTQANLNTLADNATALETRVSANLDIVTDNAAALETRVSANLDIVTDNAIALESSVTANLNTLSDNTTALETSVTANLNTLTANLNFLEFRVESNVGSKADLVTVDTSNLVSAINEVYLKTGFPQANIADIVITQANISSNTGSITLDAANLLLLGNLIVSGNTTQVDTTVTTLQDPIITLAGNNVLAASDGKDRGIEFRYYEDSQSKIGFFGWDASANAYTFLLDATNEGEIFTGTAGDINVANISAASISADTTYSNVVASNVTAETTYSNVVASNIVTASMQVTNLIADSVSSTANTLSLGTSVDLDFLDGAYQYLTSSTTVTEAIDALNEVLENVRNDTFVKAVSFVANTTSGNSPLPVTLNITPTGNANNYEISWGDGTSNTSTSSTSVSHTYNVPNGGFQSITVTAKNTSGTGEGSEAFFTRENYINIQTPSPIAAFSVADSTIDDSGSIVLTNSSQYADSYEINWGDGSSNTSLGSSGAGTPGGGTVSHTYNNSAGDAEYTITLTAASSSNGQDTSTTSDVYVYSVHTPAFTANVTSGNNEEATSGLPVTFTNTTATSPGNNSDFPDTIRYQWVWGDGNSEYVTTGSGSSGDTNQTISHTFALSDPTVEETFDVTLSLYNGHSTSPFTSTATTITVRPDPRSEYTGTMTTISQGLNSSSVRLGYLFTDYNGNKRNVATFINQSENTDTYEWDFGDSNTVSLSEGAAGTPSGANIIHEYTSTGTYDLSLLATGDNSLTATDDTDTRTSYIQILAAPSAPAGLSSKTISMTSEDVGIDPLLTSSFDDNTGGATASPGNAVNRTVDQTGYVSTDILNSYAYNAVSGTLSAIVNGSADGSKAFTTGNDAGTYTSLVISEDIDANGSDANGNAVSGGSKIYPEGFYRVFKAFVQKSATALSDGLNSFSLQHSTEGSTNTVEIVKETLIDTPSLDLSAATLTETTAGTYRYISGIPYYNTGGQVQLSGAKAYDWIDQTYRDTTTPFEIAPATNFESTSGDAISTQTKNYNDLDGASSYLFSSIPLKGTGVNSSNKYTLGDISINVNGSAKVSETLKFRMKNVNGTGSYEELSSTKLQVYSQSLSGFTEELITVSDDLGASYTDDAKRIVISGASGATPSFNSSTDYYNTSAWSGLQTVAGTDEAIVRWDTLKHFTTDLSTGYLPAGPDLATGRNGAQFIRLAFRRSNMANFKIRLTGTISSLHIALPGSGIDSSSSANGWLDATIQYNGAGQPGGNTGNGGNGSNGCALTGADVVPTGTSINNQAYTLTFGTENASNATGNQVLISIGLSSSQSLTALSFEEAS